MGIRTFQANSKRWIRYHEGVEAKQYKTGEDQTKLRHSCVPGKGTASLQVDHIRGLGTADKQGCGFRIKRTAQRASSMATGKSAKNIGGPVGLAKYPGIKGIRGIVLRTVIHVRLHSNQNWIAASVSSPTDQATRASNCRFASTDKSPVHLSAAWESSCDRLVHGSRGIPPLSSRKTSIENSIRSLEIRTNRIAFSPEENPLILGKICCSSLHTLRVILTDIEVMGTQGCVCPVC